MSSKQQRRVEQDEQHAKKAAAAMTVATELVLVRHGETDWNKEHRLQGQQQPGPPLNELGWQQCKVLSQALVKQFSRFDAVYSSDLLRTVQTAQVLAAQYQLQVQQHPGLRERNVGLLQGLTYSEAPRAQPEAWAALQSSASSSRIPGGGESLDDLQQRITAALLDIAGRHPGQRVLIVSHGGTLHATHRAARGYPAKGKVLNCGISVLMAEPLGSSSSHKRQQQHCPQQQQTAAEQGVPCQAAQPEQQHQQQCAVVQCEPLMAALPSESKEAIDSKWSCSGSFNSSGSLCKACSGSKCIPVVASCTSASSNAAAAACCGDGNSCDSSERSAKPRSLRSVGDAAGGGSGCVGSRGGRFALLVWNDGHELAAQGMLGAAGGFGGSAREA